MAINFENCYALLPLVNRRAKKRQKKLILMRLDEIGDFIIWLNAAKEYKRKYAQYEVILICKNAVQPIAEKLDYFDKVIPIDMAQLKQGNVQYLVMLRKMLMYARGGYLIQAVSTRNICMELVAACTPAARKIAIISDNPNISPKEKMAYNRVYDRIIDIPIVWEHEALKNARFMRKIGFKYYRASKTVLPGTVGETIDMPEKFYCIALGTSSSSKTPDVGVYIDTARYIYDKYHLTCCLLGTGEDQEAERCFLRNCKSISVFSYVGKTTILQYIEIIRKAFFVLSGDSSAAHIAVAVGTQSIATATGFHYGRFLPYDLEEVHSKDKLPIICNEKEKCFCCNIDKHRFTQKCKINMQRKGKPSCILAVKSDLLIRGVRQFMEGET